MTLLSRKPNVHLVVILYLWLGALLFAPTSHATMAKALNLKQLVAKADYIVVATAEGRQSRWDKYGQIVTDVTIQVVEALKGETKQGDKLVVTILGGVLDNVGMRVEGEANLPENGSAIVFLRKLPSSGELRVVGMSQGVFRMKQESDQLLVLPSGEGQTLVQPDETEETAEMQKPVRAPQAAQELLNEIRQLVSECYAQ